MTGLDAWTFFNNASGVFGTLCAVKVVVDAANSTYVWVTRDGVIVPAYLRSIEEELERIEKILQGLSEEDKKLIEKIRQDSGISVMTIDNLQQDHKAHQSELRFQILEYNKAGWLATWVPLHPAGSDNRKNAKDLREKVTQLHINVLDTTTGRLRKEKLRQNTEDARKLREVRDAEEGLARDTDVIDLPVLTSTPGRTPP